MSYVDVHVLHMPDECPILRQRCEESLLLEPSLITVHHISGIPNDVLGARLSAFEIGDNPYVSYCDPDDEIISSTVFKQCINILNTNPQIGGIYTNSIIMRNDKPQTFYKEHVWSKEYHANAALPVHQLTVVRRCVVERATKIIQNDNFMWGNQLPEQIHHAICASIAPWYFLNHISYQWNDLPQGHHHKLDPELRCKTREFIRKLLLD